MTLREMMGWSRGKRADRDVALSPLDDPHDFASSVRLGDAARDSRDWAEAMARYRTALETRPGDSGIWVQLGHAAKGAGDLPEAESAYRRAAEVDPRVADTHLQLGHILKLQGRREEAITAYAAAAARDPSLASARNELVHLGARDFLPEAATRSTAMWQRLSRVGEALSGGLDATRDWIGGAAYPVAGYDRFRRDIPIRPPPGPLPDPAEGALVVLVDALAAAPFLIRETLRSLQAQSVRRWRAIVVAPSVVREHPIGSFADTDLRIAFVDVADHAAAIDPAARHVVSVTAGTMLDPEALAWLVFAAERTDAVAVFADHDHGIADPDLGTTRADPWIAGVYDPVSADSAPTPAIVLAKAGAVRATLGEAVSEAESRGGDWLRRSLLARAAQSRGVPNIPRLLATVLELPLVARGGAARPGDDQAGRFTAPGFRPPPPRPAPARNERIAIIIPTRDAADMLARVVDSLRETARDPRRLDIIVIDNRSAKRETAELLESFASNAIARTIPMDAAFNWSLASNIGTEKSDAPILLFANNDLEMRSQGWDDILIDALSIPGAGAVGARLLYPGETIQHGGMVFGMGSRGSPEHEGRYARADDAGANRRLITQRSVAAVTGAFLGVARKHFDAVGGFDAAHLFVGYNDIDFCLRLREIGLRILYCPAIEAIHYESATRGYNESKADVAWDEGERADILARWGQSLSDDPGVSPYWAIRGVPFDGLREPSLHDIVRHIDRSARSDPWRPTRRAEQEHAAWSPAALGHAVVPESVSETGAVGAAGAVVEQ